MVTIFLPTGRQKEKYHHASLYICSDSTDNESSCTDQCLRAMTVPIVYYDHVQILIKADPGLLLQQGVPASSFIIIILHCHPVVY